MRHWRETALLGLLSLSLTESFCPLLSKPVLPCHGVASSSCPRKRCAPNTLKRSSAVRKLPLLCSHAETLTQFATSTFPTSQYVPSEAKNLAEVLSAFWNVVVEVMDGEPGTSIALAFPDCKLLENPTVVNRFMGHLEVCRDSCDDFGSRVVFQIHNVGLDIPPVFLIRSSPVHVKEDGDFDDDDDWGNDEDWSASILDKYKHLLDDEEETEEEWEFRQLTEVPEDDKEVLTNMREWVDVVISDMGICPFSQSADKAGLPLGPVHYPIFRGIRPEEVYAKYWDEVNFLITSDEKDIATTLLILPQFGIANVEGFTAFTDTLSSPLEALGIEKYIQLVFFHPQWVFRDGEDRMGSSGAANFARRSPFPMINILRTPQVRLAQKSIPTGLVYTQNEETLMEIGREDLQEMLIQRDWSPLKDQRVDRRYNKLGKIAQMLIDADGAPAQEVKERLEQQIKEMEEAKQAKAKQAAPPKPTPPSESPGGDADSKP